MQTFDIPDYYMRWIPLVLAVIAGGVGAGLEWILASEWRMTAAVIGFIAGFLFISLSVALLASFLGSLSLSFNQQMNHVMNRLNQNEQELRSMINIRPLMKDSLLEFVGGPLTPVWRKNWC